MCSIIQTAKVQPLVQADRGLVPPPAAEVGHLGGVRSQWCNRRPQEQEEGGRDEGGTEGSCRAMNSIAVKVLTGVVLVVALLLVALLLVVPGLSWADVLHFMTTSNLPCGCMGQ
jgi:hypothetical protein